jgi:hypothetical protein
MCITLSRSIIKFLHKSNLSTKPYTYVICIFILWNRFNRLNFNISIRQLNQGTRKKRYIWKLGQQRPDQCRIRQIQQQGAVPAELKIDRKKDKNFLFHPLDYPQAIQIKTNTLNIGQTS